MKWDGYSKKRERINDVPTRNRKNAIAAVSLVILILLAILIFRKPSITGKAVLGKEAVYSENLDIERNESSSYEWSIKNPGKMTSLKATGSVTSNGSAKIYVEKNGTRYLIFDSEKQLFDINIHVLSDYKKIMQGEKILVEISLLNLRGFGSGNVDVKYSIKDQKGNLIALQEEVTYVETQAKFVRELLMPDEIRPATYVAFVEVFANSTKVGSGSDSFEVISGLGEGYGRELRYYIIGLALIIVAGIASIYGAKYLKKIKKRIEIKEKMPEEKAGKIELELKAIEDAHKSGFISEQSYQREIGRLREKLNNAKGADTRDSADKGFMEKK